jgi:hypothetical protein
LQEAKISYQPCADKPKDYEQLCLGFWEQTYDIVYTGKGALTWLYDIDRWAEVVTQLLNPGGRLYLVEFHPIAWTLDAENWSIVTDYFANEPVIEHEPQGSYAVPNVETKWNSLCFHGSSSTNPVC